MGAANSAEVKFTSAHSYVGDYSVRVFAGSASFTQAFTKTEDTTLIVIDAQQSTATATAGPLQVGGKISVSVQAFTRYGVQISDSTLNQQLVVYAEDEDFNVHVFTEVNQNS